MKTYIWNQEYSVNVANAETLEDARKLLIDKYEKEYVEQCSNYPFRKKVLDVKYNILIEYLKKQDPDIILEPNTAISYEHANE